MGRKGNNAYAAQLMAAKAAMTQEAKRALVGRCITTIFQASAIALNDEFGFGAERIERFREKLNRTIEEYGTFLDDTDVDYADGKLEEAYLRIVGKEDQEA